MLAASSQNVAITFWLAFIVTLQPATPLHAPSHSRKFQPLAGASLKVTVDPVSKLAVQALFEALQGSDPVLTVMDVDWPQLVATANLWVLARVVSAFMGKEGETMRQ